MDPLFALKTNIQTNETKQNKTKQKRPWFNFADDYDIYLQVQIFKTIIQYGFCFFSVIIFIYCLQKIAVMTLLSVDKIVTIICYRQKAASIIFSM